MSLDLDNLETPAEAFDRLLPTLGQDEIVTLLTVGEESRPLDEIFTRRPLDEIFTVNVLTIGAGSGLFNKTSDIRARQEEYAALLAEREPGSAIHKIVYTDERHEPLAVGDRLFFHPIDSVSRWTMAEAAFRNGLSLDSAFDLVLTQAPFDDAVVGLGLARYYDAKFLTQHHSPFFDDPLWREDGDLWPLKVALARFVRSQMSAVRVVSRSAVDWYREQNVARDDIYHCPVSITLPETTEGVSLDASDNVVCVGRLIERKGIDDLIAAFDTVTETHPDADLHIVGSGPDQVEQRLQDVARGHGLSEDVHFTGYVSRLRLMGYYRAADVFVSPSLLEPYGRVMVESLWEGTPVVATDTVGARDIVDDRWGRIVPKRDPNALASAVTDLLESPDRLEHMGDIGQQYVQTEHEPAKLRSDWVDIWRAVGKDDPSIRSPRKQLIVPPEEFQP
jgi:glycosyltransferase involved in cell wall biosynthesis